jgi:dipeptidyl aminopeptidase/acylaminoacyl peptidase
MALKHWRGPGTNGIVWIRFVSRVRRSSVVSSFRSGLAALAVALLVLAVPRASTLAAQDAATLTENPDHDRYVQPPASIRRIFETDKNYATLDNLSPDGDHFLVVDVDELSTLELMSRETYRLAEMEIRPGTDRLWHLDTYGVVGFRFYSLSRRAFVDAELPEGSFASDFTWSPDGTQMAFLAHLPSRTEVWTADPATGRTRRVADARVMATAATSANGQGTRPSDMLQWTPQGTLLTLLVPAGRGAEPARNPVPSGPKVRRTRPEPTRNPTYPNLLQDEHDEMLFEFYTKSQLAELAPGKRPVLLGEPRMYESISLSADGAHVLATWMDRPFSFITSYRGFPRKSAVLDRQGAVVGTLSETPLREGRTPGGSGSTGGNGPRAFAWHPGNGGLAFLERAPANGGGSDAPRPDRVKLATAPFDLAQAAVVAESEDPIRSATFSRDGRHLFAEVTRSGDAGLAHWSLGGGTPARAMTVAFHKTDDPTAQPGDLVTLRSGNGLSYALVSTDGAGAYLRGAGLAADFRPRPFVDRVPVEGGTATRVFEGSRDSWEQPLVPLDADLGRMVVSRESRTDFPDSYLWSRQGGFGDNLTNNVDPFPEVTAAVRRDFEFTRQDGLKVQGRISMPVGWKQGDPPVPAMFWTYPREFEKNQEYERSAIQARNHNAFTHMSWLRWSDIWLTQGYALVYPDIPIIGENYNDTYISSLVDAMYGAIRAVDGLGMVDIDRIGHGGHSYGAFATANILANAPFFKAGIAGDGAYNRSLTPDGFQAEERSIWEAPQTYIEMSPFFKADQMNTPLLMYHGGADNNTGTFPVQSQRFISALTILGKNAVLYEYPFESHTPRARENKLDMWARFVDWFDRYVKNAQNPGAVSQEPDAP